MKPKNIIYKLYISFTCPLSILFKTKPKLVAAALYLWSIMKILFHIVEMMCIQNEVNNIILLVKKMYVCALIAFQLCDIMFQQIRTWLPLMLAILIFYSSMHNIGTCSYVLHIILRFNNLAPTLMIYWWPWAHLSITYK